MPSRSTRFDAVLPTIGGDLSDDDLFDVLADGRRRDVLRTLQQRGGTLDLASLADTLHDGDGREEFAIRLHHVVLPKLARAALIDRSSDEVTLTDDGEAVATWLASVTSR
jgi:hypothetical protein